MFAYNPAVNDNRDQYIMAAANTQSQAMQGLGDNIGGALQTIGSVYGEIEGRKAKGRAFKKTLEVLGPSIGMTTDKLKAAFGDLRNDMDYYNASEMLMPILPSMINLQLSGMNADVRRQQMGVQTAMPGIRATIDNTQDVVNQGGPQIQGARFQRNPTGN